MRAVRSKDTTPEITVRKLLSRDGYRYRLHYKKLLGSPDIAFPGRKKAIFVNGCFWHGHSCGRGARVPKTNREYWTAKVSRNRERDDTIRRSLRLAEWKILTIWECQIKDLTLLRNRLVGFLET